MNRINTGPFTGFFGTDGPDGSTHSSWEFYATDDSFNELSVIRKEYDLANEKGVGVEIYAKRPADMGASIILTPEECDLFIEAINRARKVQIL